MTSAPSRRVLALLAALSVSGWLSACAPPAPETAPPLRPLLYTEAPRGAGLEILGYQDWVDPNVDPTAWPTEFATSVAGANLGPHAAATTPEALLLDVFAGLVTGDRERVLAHTFEPEALASAGHMSRSGAAATAAEIREETLATLAVFQDGGAAAAARALQAGQIVVGRGRRLDGGLAREEDRVIMHWGNEMTFAVEGTDLEFVLRFPNLLLDDDGIWRLRDAPKVDRRFSAYRAMGMHLMPELMDVEHAAVPLAVGNYWHYRTRQPGIGEEYGVLTRGGYRDSVIEVESYDGYRVARLRRVYDDPNRANERISWLVTPRRLYVCDRECAYRASNPAWIVAYGERTTPLLVFPLTLQAGWGVGGLDSRENVRRVGPEAVPVMVPAGTFPDAFEIIRSTPQGRQSSYFVPSIGFVLHRVYSTVETELVELVDYRILP